MEYKEMKMNTSMKNAWQMALEIAKYNSNRRQSHSRKLS